MIPNRKLYPFVLILIIVSIILAGCGGEEESTSVDYSLAPEPSLSDEILAAPASVQEAYRFALANPEVLKQIPCYCGCGAVGHKNNYQCYVASLDADGNPVFDAHALG
jgi:hypothetical protein